MPLRFPFQQGRNLRKSPRFASGRRVLAMKISVGKIRDDLISGRDKGLWCNSLSIAKGALGEMWERLYWNISFASVFGHWSHMGRQKIISWTAFEDVLPSCLLLMQKSQRRGGHMELNIYLNQRIQVVLFMFRFVKYKHELWYRTQAKTVYFPPVCV